MKNNEERKILNSIALINFHKEKLEKKDVFYET